MRNPFGVFMIVPKFDFTDIERQNQISNITYDRTAKVRIIAHNGVQHLNEFQ